MSVSSGDTPLPLWQIVADLEGKSGIQYEVVLLDKEEKLGGNSAKASSGISALASSEGDNIDAYLKDTIESGGGRSRPELVAELVVSCPSHPEL